MTHVMDELDRSIVLATQGGLPLVPRPYARLADTVGTSQEDVMSRLRRLLAIGAIRRIAAVPNHYALGLAANAMTVWDVDDAALPELGPRVGRLDFVSHCYHRPRRLPEWPFNLFAMVHGRGQSEVDAKIEVIAALLGSRCKAHDALLSTRILKKTGLRIAG
ncbi:MAG: Lrp/AsnC family transcriptional regulator [Hyphomicrobiales bacterium]|nr:MAG: Lrp/AsnC family transcriptional regulator [Hyphomicrobiales bacterium]